MNCSRAISARVARWRRATPLPARSLLAPPSERVHWLTAPRSDVLQSSPVHAGLAADPARALEDLFKEYVLGQHPLSPER